MSLSADGACLVGLTGEFAGKSFPIAERLVVGRQEPADVRIADMEVSRRHCQVERVADGFQMIDLGSRGGTCVNDHAVQSIRLRSGDVLAVGPHRFRFESSGVHTPAADVVPDTDEGHFTLKEIPIHQFDLAEQLRVAREHADLERVRHHLEVAQQFARAVQTTLETTALIDLTLEELFRVFDKMDSGAVFLRDPVDQRLTPATMRERRGQTVLANFSRTVLNFVEAEQKAVLSLDVSQDERFQRAPSVNLSSMRTHMCVPLAVRGEVVGAIYLVAEGKDRPASGFNDDDLALLTALAGTVAVCVKNAALAREAQRVAQLSAGLQRYVSPEVTRCIIEQGVQGMLEARTVEGVAMFCDVVGFTSLSQRLAPERMARLLNRYFARAIDIVFRHHGGVNKFGGDSFLAVWGAVESRDDDLAGAIRAALEIQNETFRLSAELTSEGSDPIQLTIGLSRGRFFAGDIGAEDRMEFTVIGDTVNIASRIQSLAHPGQVLTTLESLSTALGVETKSVAGVEANKRPSDEMNLVVYPETPIRGRTAGVAIASVRSIVSKQTAGPMGDNAEVLASIPIEISGLATPAILTRARLDERPVVTLLMQQAAVAGASYELTPRLPELPHGLAAARAECLECVPEGALHRVIARLDESSCELSSLLTPSGERRAAGVLRSKA